MEEKEYIVEGFKFMTEKEAEEANNEVRGIQYVVSRTDMNNPKVVLAVYNRLVERKMFNTPIGIKFLKELQDSLYANELVNDEDILPIPAVLDLNYSHPVSIVEPRKKKKKKMSYKAKMINSIIINIILVIAIIAMFIISAKSKNVNIINYEERIQNQYSIWEEELNERESELNEREKQLNVNE